MKEWQLSHSEQRAMKQQQRTGDRTDTRDCVRSSQYKVAEESDHRYHSKPKLFLTRSTRDESTQRTNGEPKDDERDKRKKG